MEFATVIGIVGSVASVVGLLLPAQTKRQRATHVIYCLFIAVIASFAVVYQQRASLSNQISNEKIEIQNTATKMVKDFDRFTKPGFVGVSLTFLKKHKAIVPAEYEQA